MLSDVGSVRGPKELVPNQQFEIMVWMAARCLYTKVEGIVGVTEGILALKGRPCFAEIPLPARRVLERS